MIRSLAAVVAAAALSTALPAAAQTSPGPGLAISDVGAWITSKGGVVEPAQRQGDEVWLTVRDGD
ncbi:MAG: D-xylose ABC transporter substrate-binding protein, partial [Alphaproteobacteria bacterium]